MIKVYDNLVNATGLWATPSIEMIALDNFLSIVRVWALPLPADEKLIAVPARALFLVVANLNSSDPLLIAYTVVGILLPPVCMLVAVTPEKEDPNAYVSFSPVLKKWSGTLNVFVDMFNAVAGSNVFWNIGTPSCFISKEVLLTLFPFLAL